MTKRMMAEREGEITRVQDTKCKTMLVRNMNERMREKECVCVRVYMRMCIIVGASLCICMRICAIA